MTYNGIDLVRDIKHSTTTSREDTTTKHWKDRRWPDTPLPFVLPSRLFLSLSVFCDLAEHVTHEPYTTVTAPPDVHCLTVLIKHLTSTTPLEARRSVETMVRPPRSSSSSNNTALELKSSSLLPLLFVLWPHFRILFPTDTIRVS